MSDSTKIFDSFVGVVAWTIFISALAAVVGALAHARCALLAHSTGRIVEMTWSGCMVETKDGLVPEANWRGGP